MSACSITVRGVVQGVGFRPFVFRLARANKLAGWVVNANQGVEIFVEGVDQNLQAFVHQLKTTPPPAAQVADLQVRAAEPAGLHSFTIRESSATHQPVTRISPDLPVCNDCLNELLDPTDRRYHYPYINCSNCGARYSLTLRLPYDRNNTTMLHWLLDKFCTRQYRDPADRRFHAQPVACPHCGPSYYFRYGSDTIRGSEPSIAKAVDLLAAGKIVAVKGLGGYHLACDATNAAAVDALRRRKYRKEKPFALMSRDLHVARKLIAISDTEEALLTSIARPILIARAKVSLPGVAPESSELGVMLPYTPLHFLLFAAGAPEVLVMTSANRSSEPIAYEDSDALDRLAPIADAFLVGERPIARRVDDSIARVGVFGPVILRRSRGYAPGAVSTIPTGRPILALGADLKNTVTLVVEGQAFVSQHIGDLSEYQCRRAFRQTIEDLLSMYEVDRKDLLVVSDAHPQYVSTSYAQAAGVSEHISIQHHRAHVASVLAERRAWTKRVIGVSFDGTGYGDDGTIWGGEIFVGNVQEGFARVAHLRPATLPGGDAAAQFPSQAAAGFLVQVNDLPDLTAPPFSFPERYRDATELLRKNLRTFRTTSIGRLFDAAAALLGFTREVSFEGQAAVWLEQLARDATSTDSYPFSFEGAELDFRPLLHSIVSERFRLRAPSEIARAFQRGIASGLAAAIRSISRSHNIDTVVLSGGVFQNELLLEDLHTLLPPTLLTIWTNHQVPPNDGGISLGQAALAAFYDRRLI
jgi:hydrogenase maturation protein HypF